LRGFKVKQIIRVALCLVMLFLVQVNLVNAVRLQDQAEADSSALGYKYIISSINFTSIERHIRYLSSLGSRVTGYPGFEEASKYIQSKFNEYGLLNVHIEMFPVLVPVSYGANITILLPEQKVIQAYPLWPNHVNPCPTPPEGITGRLVYVGGGSLEEIEEAAKKCGGLEGSIVLIEADTRWLWKNAVIFGAKAVIFIEPLDWHRVDAMQKLLGIPLNIPRLYVNRTIGKYLRSLCMSGNVTVNVKSDMRWELVTGKNIVGVVKSSIPSSETVIISAYYDSISVIPELSPGASESIGVATLLELARFFSQHPPKAKNILFLALSGHHQGLSGARDFINRHFDDIGKNLSLFISMDLDSGSQSLAIRLGSRLGAFYDYSLLRGPTGLYWDNLYNRLNSFFFHKCLPKIESETGKEYSVIDLRRYPGGPLGTGWEQIPTVMDDEPFAIAATGGAFGFQTVNTLRSYFATPFDLPSRISFENLKPQIEFIFCSLCDLVNDPSIRILLNPTRFSMAMNIGFATLKGQVVKFNPLTGWYESVPHAIIRVNSQLSTTIQNQMLQFGVPPGSPPFPTGFDIILRTDEEGFFEIHGVQPGALYTIQAYVLDSMGNIKMANELGAYAGAAKGLPYTGYPLTFSIRNPTMEVQVPVFECGSITLLQTYDPLRFSPSVVIVPLKFWSHTSDIYFGPTVGAPTGPDAIVFIRPNVPTELIVYIGSSRTFLINATKDNPSGSGYSVKVGQNIILRNAPLPYVKNLHYVVDSRLNALSGMGVVYSIIADKYHKAATSSLMEAEKELYRGDYGRTLAFANRAWSCEVKAYPALMDLLYDVINTTIFFFIMLIPFAFALQTLVFPNVSGVKRILYVAGIYIAFFIPVFFLHPGFRLATNIYMTLLGFVLLVVISIVVAIIAIEMHRFLKDIKIGALKLHLSEISRSSAVALAFSMGIHYMRRRKWRTVMTLFSLSAISFSLISFSSMSFSPVVEPSAVNVPLHPTQIRYQGVLLRGDPNNPMAPIPEIIYYNLKELYGKDNFIAPRAWLYPPLGILELPGANGEIGLINAFLGLTDIENEVTKVNETIIQGKKWFDREDMNRPVCMISDTLAKRLGIDLKEGKRNLCIFNVNLTVISIFNSDLLTSLKDIDLKPITAIDLYLLLTGGQPVPAPADSVIIIPLPLALKLGGNIYSVSIMPKTQNSTLAREIAFDLAFSTNAYVWGSWRGKLYSLISLFEINFTGMETLVPLMVITAILVLNTMLGIIAERKDTIKILSIVGLSPIQIASIFFAESAIYAFISGIAGYIGGLLSNALLHSVNLLPKEFSANFASSYVILAILINLVAILLSTIYPLYQASKLVTPSIERKWKIPTEPMGDEWIIPLPFVATEEELPGIFSFMKEYFEYHAYERVGSFQLLSKIEYREAEEKGSKAKMLVMKTRHIPWDLTIIQQTRFVALRSKNKSLYSFEVHITRETGYTTPWKATNQYFLDDIRHQLLIWRYLGQKDRKRYKERWLKEEKALLSNQKGEGKFGVKS